MATHGQPQPGAGSTPAEASAPVGPWSVFSPFHTLPTIADRRFGIFGLGVVGRAVANLLAVHGAALTLVDERAASAPDLAALWPAASRHCGAVAEDAFFGCQAVVVSPGIAPHHPALVAARQRGVPTIGEVELLEHFAPSARVLAITGTNGKSTTTALLGALLGAGRRPVFVGGNLSPPISSWLLLGPPDADLVLELSSYQIDQLQSQRPRVVVVLNVTPDHLERYGTFECYQASKARLVASVADDGVAVLNADDPLVRAMASKTKARTLWFGSQAPLPGDGLLLTPSGHAQGVGSLATAFGDVPLRHGRLLGLHNLMNALAALLAASAHLGTEAETTARLLAAYRAFPGLPHRLEWVGDAFGATWLNDSKATNDAAAATAVAAMDTPFVLLLGGQDKGAGYAQLIAALARRPARHIIVFGAAKDILKEALVAAHWSCTEASTLEEACEQAAQRVEPGDRVLLSPACASFDAFQNFEARGAAFARWVATGGQTPDKDP